MTRLASLLKASLVATLFGPLAQFGPGAGSVHGQVNLAPKVDWSSIDHEDERTETGTYYSFVNNVPTPLVDQQHGAPQDASESGEEWWFAHKNYFTGGQHTGYVTAGYVSWPNSFWWGTGCTSIPVLGDENADELELPGYRKGETRSVVARYDLNGERVWYRTLLPGLAYNVTQDDQGNLLIVGNAYTNVWPADVGSGDNTVIRYNADATTDLSDVDCTQFGDFKIKGYITKLDPQGNVLWTTILHAEDALATGWAKGS